LMGGLLHLVQRGGACAGCGPPSPLLAVPNVTAHPSPDLSPFCRKSTVAGLVDFVDRVAVNIVAKVEHVQFGRICRKWLIFVARMSNILSTLSLVCTSPYGALEGFMEKVYVFSLEWKSEGTMDAKGGVYEKDDVMSA